MVFWQQTSVSRSVNFPTFRTGSIIWIADPDMLLISYWSGRIRILPSHNFGHWKKYFVKKIVLLIIYFLLKDHNWTFFWNFFQPLKISKDPDPRGDLITDPPIPDPRKWSGCPQVYVILVMGTITCYPHTWTGLRYCIIRVKSPRKRMLAHGDNKVKGL
jgi:hypothetical protein